MKKAILCEGQLDAIAFHRAGIGCAVAPLGTAFTPEQAKMIRRYTNNIILAFDADGAGQKAVLRAAEILLPLSVDLRIIRIPGGKDPDELFTRQGPAALEEVVNNAVPWLEVMKEILPERFPMNTPVGRSDAAGFVADYLKLVNDQVELEVYIDEVAKMLEVTPSAIKSALDKSRNASSAYRPPQQENSSQQPAAASQPEKRDPARVALLVLLEAALSSVDHARKIAGALEDVELEKADPVVSALDIVINHALNDEMDEVVAALNNMLIEIPAPEVSRILVSPGGLASPERAIDEALTELHRIRKCTRRNDLLAQLRCAGDGETRLKLLMEITALNQTGDGL